MRLVFMLAVTLSLPALAAAQVTPEQDVKFQQVLREIREMDEELSAIQTNRETLETSKAARLDEYQSLITRYPGIIITPTSTTSELYHALYFYRMNRAATVKSIAAEKLRYSRTRSCVALQDLRNGRAELEASDTYKKARLQDRIELRKSFDDLIMSLTAEDGDPCLPKP